MDGGWIKVRQALLNGISIQWYKWDLEAGEAWQEVIATPIYACIQLDGSVRFGSDAGALYVYPGQHNIFFCGDKPMRRSTITQQGAILEFRLTSEKYAELLEDTSFDLPKILASNNLHIDLSLRQAICELLDQRLPANLQRAYLRTKSAEILLLQQANYQRSLTTTVRYCKTEYDIERLTFARDYLVEHIDLPPSLPELARIAGINEVKLKRGFKELFDHTVFGYLAEYRLQQARAWLLAGEKTPTEAAFALGYASLQHFSAAFRKRYGLTPRGVK